MYGGSPPETFTEALPNDIPHCTSLCVIGMLIASGCSIFIVAVDVQAVVLSVTVTLYVFGSSEFIVAVVWLVFDHEYEYEPEPPVTFAAIIPLLYP